MSKSPCKCDDCVIKFTKKQREKMALLMAKTTNIIGDFKYCRACEFLFETVDISKLYFCSNCSHLYEGKTGIDEDECKCRKEKYSIYFRHIIETYSMGVCAYCKSEDIEYEIGLDNSVKFILDDNEAFFIMTCKDCGKESREYYNIEFRVSEGN